MDADKPNARQWMKTVLWGGMTALLYLGMFYYADMIIHLAHSTPESCVVIKDSQPVYFHKVDVATCTAHGGHIEPAQAWHVLIPILIAFALSFTHGAFTGLFWEVMGLKPANRPKARH